MPTPMPPIDVIASDLDGSLLGVDHKVTLPTRRTLKTIVTREHPGAKVILATGRNYFDVKRLCDQLIVYVNDESTGVEKETPASPCDRLPHAEKLRYRDFYLIASNGAVAKHAVTEEVVYNQAIDPDIARGLFNLLPDTETEINTNAYQYDDWISRLDWTEMEKYHQESGLRYVLCPSGPEPAASLAAARERRIADMTADPTAAQKRVSPEPLIPDGNYEGVNKVFYLGSPAALAVLKQRIIDTFGEDRLSFTNSMTECLDVMAANVNKGTALEHVLNHIAAAQSQMPVEELLRRTVAFGDGLNDAEMLSVAGRGYIMGNCNPALPKRCPQLEVIRPCTEDGIAVKLCELFSMPPP